MPRILHRANKLDEMQAFTVKRPDRLAKRLHCRGRGVDTRCVKENSIAVVADFRVLRLQHLGTEVIHLIELKTSVLRQELAAVFHDQLRGRRIPDLDFVSSRRAGGGEECAKKQAHQKRGCAPSPSASWRTRL